MGWLCAVPMGLGWKHAHKLDGTLIPQRLMSPFFLACTAMSGFLGSLMVLALVKMPVLIPVGACCLMVETIYNGISEWRMRRRLLQIEQEYEAKCEELKKWANSIKEEEFEF
ncbi:hypothetical protein C9374_002016 [Naegleria lovaniensis]|uniref:Uncharacterized protein n=1 Tax=Naegleria lovaniensis TaxID=51637 RepID=A0AA88KMY1_NAELO|nr:uncharacterized protein C9374_002016 [Naegleria lovaniensis]KAG2386981.1 hypothetical protein C9374_002016 [Naegleria lovaniensis]